MDGWFGCLVAGISYFVLSSFGCLLFWFLVPWKLNDNGRAKGQDNRKPPSKSCDCTFSINKWK